jgi:hypothetical protein
MTRTLPALSIKQPWAALIVRGLKSIEVRTWPTIQRGWILIHASSQEDELVEGWKRVPEYAAKLSQLRGGILGAACLVDCRTYRDRKEFSRDQKRHLNRPEWFREPALYGFVLERAIELPFHKIPGWVKFFEVAYAGGSLPALLR